MTPNLDPERVERAAGAMASKRAELIHAPLSRIYDDLARAAIIAYLSDTHVVVPVVALLWLNGEAPDADGKWFGECAPHKHTPRYWWRSKFRAMLSATPTVNGKGE